MKLSELVNFRNQLDQLSITMAHRNADLEINKITHLVNSQPMQFGQFAVILENQRASISQSFTAFDQELQLLKQEVTKSIAVAEKPWFEESYRLYEQEMCNDTPAYILTRRLGITKETEQNLRARLMNYTDWHYPGMIIRPGEETFMHDMVGFDPLYIVDEHYDLLAPCLANYPEAYQRRLRPYVINERVASPILHKIPNNQFGACLVYNFFNFRPFEVIKRYLEEILQKLRPGGVLIMTINDCDRDKGVMLVEQHYACYTPGYLIVELAQSLGYESVIKWHDDGPSTWIELKRPGELTSLRGGQSMAKIMPK